jgi:N-acyl-D-amino-acid deacylase
MLSDPRAMVGSDGIYSGGRDHPRGYAAFTRYLGEFVGGAGVLTLEEAVRRITSFPARRFGLAGRGRLEPGFAADVVVLDPGTGARDVLVNGVAVLRDGVLTGARPGRGLRSVAA